MKQHLQDLTEIRQLMERSTRFISLSGLSGISAGIFALIGAYLAYQRIAMEPNADFYLHLSINSPITHFLIIDALLVLLFSLGFSIYFTVRNSNKKGVKIWDNTSKRLLINMAIPLVAGGLFCLIMLEKAPQLIDAATLVFYGLALINASKFTFDNVKYLGYIQICLGLACGLVNQWQYGLFFWAFGFGICHIIYGILMYRQNEAE